MGLFIKLIFAIISSTVRNYLGDTLKTSRSRIEQKYGKSQNNKRIKYVIKVPIMLTITIGFVWVFQIIRTWKPA